VETRARFGSAERSSWRRQLPSLVAAEVERRRDGILAAASGRLLDLDEPGAIDLVHGASSRASGSPASPGDAVDEGYDTIVSTCRLVDLADLPAALAGLRRLLAPDGELHVVEPVNHPGAASLLISSAFTWSPALAGLHLGRDVVRATRAADLAVVDLDRFTIATPVWPLRRFVQARAILIDGHGHTNQGAS
jgi:hypothetical protein